MVSFNLTPFSSMSTVCFRISTVWLMRSAEEEEAVFAGYLHLFSGQQGALSLPTLVPWPQSLTIYSGPLLLIPNHPIRDPYLTQSVRVPSGVSQGRGE